MNLVIPWIELVGLIERYEPLGKAGCPPFAVCTMLRIHFMQQWFGLSDPTMGEALHDTPLYCEFAGLDAGIARLPDESTIVRFRHLLEEHTLSIQLMAIKDVMRNSGTVVEVTLIVVPSSTKNNMGERDPELHQAKKGKQWHFGMEAHIGVDAECGLVHTAIGRAANVNDVTQGDRLLHGQETVVFGDVGYQGATKLPEATGVNCPMRPGERRAPNKQTALGALLYEAEQLKDSVRAKVEHPFRVIKCEFGFTTVRYRGLAKNTAPLGTLFASGNLWMARRPIPLGGARMSVSAMRADAYQRPEMTSRQGKP